MLEISYAISRVDGCGDTAINTIYTTGNFKCVLLLILESNEAPTVNSRLARLVPYEEQNTLFILAGVPGNDPGL